MKVCSRCKEEKEFNFFHKDSRKKDGYKNHCKACWKIRYRENNPIKSKIILSKEDIEKNKQRKKEYNKQWVKDNENHIKKYQKEYSRKWYQEKGKEYFLKKSYGITLNIFELMWEEQKGLCFICGRKMKKSGKNGPRKYAVDHCHETNKVRGLLCSACNTRIIPHFEKHPERINNLKIYLTRDVDYRELNE